MRLRRRRTKERPLPTSQAVLPFLARRERRERVFKRMIMTTTLLAIVAIVGGTPIGRGLVRRGVLTAHEISLRWMGLPEDRAVTDARWRALRDEQVRAAEAVWERFYHHAVPAIRHLFDAAGLAPGKGLVRWGNYDRTLLISGEVFEPDELRSYRLKPNTRSVWLRQITLREGPFTLLLIPDTPEARSAGSAAGGIVVEESAQTTNSWGLRGPEPDLDAEVRGLVLGDSLMQGMFIADDETPPIQLERALAAELGQSVSILNTGHLGYSIEQYFQTLLAYGDRFQPHFVVVAVFANDFGDAEAVLSRGEGDWDEAAYWLGEIQQYCRSRTIPCLVTPVPVERQLTSERKDGNYPGQVSNITRANPMFYFDPLDDFVNAHLTDRVEAEKATGHVLTHSPLYNGHIGDGHLSPQGAKLWAELLARRIALILRSR